MSQEQTFLLFKILLGNMKRCSERLIENKKGFKSNGSKTEKH
jgi:hypothetical protein